MKKIILYFMLLALTSLTACDPVESRETLDGAITAEQLNISATPIVVNGKNSNKVILKNNSPVLSWWNYGTGTTQMQTDTVLLVLKGENSITFTGQNGDGSQISKTITVNVEELSFPVPPEWGYLCGSGSKTWVWDETAPSVWGNGGYKNDKAPAWWTLKIGDINGQAANEGTGASMDFSISGAAFTKLKSDGSSEKGSFALLMTSVTLDDNGNVWAKGKLKTKGTTVLCGKSPNEGGAPVYEYDILILNDNKMILSYPEPGVGSGGTAWFWVFRAK
ncbi:hypothetical protein [Dysgonomonas sp. ZJ279]|uniref:hypothetical protein n=1 Tax=Dysgonomonas sp. ZJ279 TaxID=2709796 RepID=UPI0013EAFCEE|nr:hypothetical protein [Dysgonomonas sp. ZJ279]